MNRWDRVPQNKGELVSAMKNDMFDPISSIYHVLLLSKGNGIEADEHIQVDGNRGRLHPAVCVHYRNRAVMTRLSFTRESICMEVIRVIWSVTCRVQVLRANE